MVRPSRFFAHASLLFLVISPIGLMAILTWKILIPGLKDPSSRIYGSVIKYPALKHLVAEPIKVKTVTVQSSHTEADISAPGESVPLESLEVSSQVSGIVKKVAVVEGQKVRQGDLLIEIDAQPFREGVEQAQLALKKAENDWNGMSKTYKQDLEQFKADSENAQNKLNLDVSNLKALHKKYRSRLEELQNNILVSKQQLRVAQQKLTLMSELKENGAVPQSEIFAAEQDYLQHQKDLATDQQKLLQEQEEMKKEINDTRQSYFENQKALIDAQKSEEQTKTNHPEQVKEAQIALDQSRISLAQARRQLQQTVILASRDGLVSRMSINVGEQANPETVLMLITQDVVFKAYIDQARLNAVKVGDEATIRLVAYPGKTFRGRVTQVNPTVETQLPESLQVGANRQYTYSAWIQLPGLKIPPGLQGYAEFTKNQNRVMLPENAVTHLSAGEGMVMLLEKNTAVLRKVRLGRRVDDQREVLGGLQPGEKVILSPRYLNSGEHLQAESTAN